MVIECRIASITIVVEQARHGDMVRRSAFGITSQTNVRPVPFQLQAEIVIDIQTGLNDNRPRSTSILLTIGRSGNDRA